VEICFSAIKPEQVLVACRELIGHWLIVYFLL
jgi:hypothetical protein